ncbi:sigma-70 family RNA polymerase sigma factor [Phytohabitans aurantiacus]|jgi:RNA polymerase sigma-70 factor (ECF subfamily)|uniref:DNA-directed RNA polymerase sigma-70 factor n=1 Tax=Phytohabitans aurantiacus TaxID=3016789 RepID=A0ABQ5R3N2_9ACTN|nr:sigma-70 family RNA polymerase sigma factor [Phytohabitans aurantiacus]GLI01389.1 DNA-directed RNA polymerase sigma-70 factor [Phytohabitans aurantiacus]
MTQKRAQTQTLGSERVLEEYRRELTAYCYRMLGSAFEAEDAAQETLVRAWKSLDKFEGRAALRSWLYRIATNVCLDMLGSAQRRARPMDMGPAGSQGSLPDAPLAETVWVGPAPDSRMLPESADPAELAVARESIRLAFVAAMQHLPPRQRAVLILREVLAWSANEVAELLDTSVPSVNSALQRARATISTTDVKSDTLKPMDDEQAALLSRYVEAFERYDMESLTALLHQDATLSMPPLSLWFRGHADISHWMLGPGSACRGSRLVPTAASGLPAFGQYKPGGPGGSYEPWALIMLEISDGRIHGLNFYLDTEHLFPLFGLPASLD